MNTIVSVIILYQLYSCKYIFHINLSLHDHFTIITNGFVLFLYLNHLHR